MNRYQFRWIAAVSVLFLVGVGTPTRAQDKPPTGEGMGLGMGGGMMGLGFPLPASSGTTTPNWVPAPGVPRCVGLAGDPWLSCDNGGVYKRSEDQAISSLGDAMRRVFRYSDRTLAKIKKPATSVGDVSCQIVMTADTLNCGGYSYKKDHTALGDQGVKPVHLPADGTSEPSGQTTDSGAKQLNP